MSEFQGILKKRYLAWGIVCSSILFFPSCFQKKYSKTVFAEPSQVSLCLEMPQNKLVFENLSAMVYDALWNHFSRVGYRLVSEKEDCYTLKVMISDVDSSHNRFLSPDLLTYAVKVRVELLCQLFDKDNKLKAQKVFFCCSLVPRAKDYVENSNFEDFEYKKLFNRYAPKVDYYFRKFLL